jgi:hypothetical protein
MMLILKKYVEIGNVEKKKKKEKGDLTNMTYMSAA